MKTLEIQNAVEILSKFRQTIRFDLVRFGSKKFGFVASQTGKKYFCESATRLDAAVGIVNRYFTAQACKDAAFINPQSVASAQGITMAFDLLLAAGYVRVEQAGGIKKAVVVESFDMNQNQ